MNVLRCHRPFFALCSEVCGLAKHYDDRCAYFRNVCLQYVYLSFLTLDRFIEHRDGYFSLSLNGRFFPVFAAIWLVIILYRARKQFETAEVNTAQFTC